MEGEAVGGTALRMGASAPVSHTSSPSSVQQGAMQGMLDKESADLESNPYLVCVLVQVLLIL